MNMKNSCCSLCNVQTHEVRLLYNHPVCKRCYYSFARRREVAFIADMTITFILIFVVAILPPLSVLVYIAFLGKDCLFSGSSPGKAVFGLRVIDTDTGKPIGLSTSIKRNLPLLIPAVGFIIQIIAAVQLRKGYRIGDVWANSKVVWKKHGEHPVFLPTSSPQFVWTEELRNEVAERKFHMAVRAEVGSHYDDATGLYHEIIDKFTKTPIAKDARIALKALQKKMNS